MPVSAVSAPVAAFVSNATSGTAPLGVQFIEESTNSPTSWVWSFGDGGTSTLQNPSHTYTNAGTYTVTLTVTNSAGSNTVTQSGYISVSKTSSAPVAAFISTVTTGIVPITVQFVDASTNTPTTWAWSFGDGGTSTLQNPSHTYTNAGTYTVTLTATNSAGSNTISQSGYITVSKVATTPAASFISTVTSGSAPLTIQFIDATSNSPTSWVWSFGDGGTSTLQNPPHTYTSTGIYTVTLTTTNSAGSDTVTEADYITVSLTVPVASFATNVTYGPSPLTVIFTDTSTHSPAEWYWTFGDGGTSYSQNETYTYMSAGTYSVSMTAWNSEGSNKTTLTDLITVTQGTTMPDAVFTSDVTCGGAPLTIQFTDTSDNYPSSWQWAFGDGETSTLENPSHVYARAGTYTVKLTAINDGGSNTVTRTGYVTVSQDVVTTIPTTAYIPSVTIPDTVALETTVGTTLATSSSDDSAGIVPIIGVIILGVTGVAVWIMFKKPPQGPRRSRGREL